MLDFLKIIPRKHAHYLHLSRDLLFTGLAGAKQLAILVGPTETIGFALKQILERSDRVGAQENQSGLSKDFTLFASC